MDEIDWGTVGMFVAGISIVGIMVFLFWPKEEEVRKGIKVGEPEAVIRIGGTIVPKPIKGISVGG